MGYDFNLYEIIDYDWENVQKEFKVKEVLYLSNSCAMLIGYWLSRNHIKIDENNFNLAYEYIEIDGGSLQELVDNLKIVLNEKDNDKRNMLALFYFPCMYCVPSWISSVEMFSESYYADLEYILECLSNVLTDNPERRMFIYNFNV